MCLCILTVTSTLITLATQRKSTFCLLKHISVLHNHSPTIRNASTIGAQALKEVHVTLDSGMCWHTVSNAEPFTHLTLSSAA